MKKFLTLLALVGLASVTTLPAQADPQSEASDEWAPERLFVFASQADAHDG